METVAQWVWYIFLIVLVIAFIRYSKKTLLGLINMLVDTLEWMLYATIKALGWLGMAVLYALPSILSCLLVLVITFGGLVLLIAIIKAIWRLV